MNKEELIWTASVAIGKGYGYEEMSSSDYMYGNESEMDNMWAYVEECQEIGRIAFREKYKEFKMYPI